MRRLFFLSVLAAIVGLGCAAVAWSAQQRSQSPSQVQLERNRLAAHADAPRLVRSIRLPAGARRITAIREHRGDALQAVMTSYVATATSVSPAGVDAYRYVIRHRPPGTKLSEVGGTYLIKNGKHIELNRSFELIFPDRTGVLFARAARVTFTKLEHGRTRINITSQSSWLVPRPTAEVVPAGVTEVVVSGTTTGSATSGSAWAEPPVTSPTTVGKLIALVDRPGIVQDVAISCPAWPGPYPQHSVTLDFENANGIALATVKASWSGQAGKGATGDECNPINFSLGDTTDPALIDMNFLEQLQRLLGVNLDR